MSEELTQSNDVFAAVPNPVAYDDVADQVTENSEPGDDRVPPTLKTAAAWSWRLIVLAVAIGVIGWITLKFSTILIAVMVALLLAVVLEPFSAMLRNKLHWPPALAATSALLLLVLAISLMMYGSGVGLFNGFKELSGQITAGIEAIVAMLTERFPDIGTQLEGLLDKAKQTVGDNSSTILGGVMSFGSSLTSFGTGFVLTLFTLFFFLKDGRQLWHWGIRLLPTHYQNRTNESGIRAWVTIGNYTRTQAIVAAVDAIGIALIAFILKTPLSLAFPIAVIVFLAAFIPIVGALISGFVAVLVVLVNTQSFVLALVMLGGILLVQQIEGNLLQPILQGNALNMHALAIVFIVTGGSMIAGIVGALFSVPIAAAINTVILYLRGHDIYPYLDDKDDRPGGPPQDFKVYREKYWKEFRENTAQELEPRAAKARRKAERAARKEAKTHNTTKQEARS